MPLDLREQFSRSERSGSNVLLKYASARGFFARLASGTFLTGLQEQFFQRHSARCYNTATVAIFAIGIFLISSCAPRQVRTIPDPSAAAKAPAGPHCPDRVDRAKTGGFVGGLFGTAVATLVGSPLLGGLYQAAGYAIGFTSDGACPKTQATVEKTALTPPNGEFVVEKAALSSSEIKEENLSPNQRP